MYKKTKEYVCSKKSHLNQALASETMVFVPVGESSNYGMLLGASNLWELSIIQPCRIEK